MSLLISHTSFKRSLVRLCLAAFLLCMAAKPDLAYGETTKKKSPGPIATTWSKIKEMFE